MSKLDTSLCYYLPRTRLRISGTATTKKNLRTGQEETTATAEIELVAGPDPDAFYCIDFAGRSLSDDALVIELSEQGLLTSSSSTSTGQLGKVISSVASVVVTVAGALGGVAGMFTRGLAGGALMMAAEEGVAPTQAPPSPEELYAQEHPDRSPRRKTLRDTIARLQKRILEERERICDTADAEARGRLKECVATLKAALEDARSEAEALDAHFKAWVAFKEAPVTRSHEFVLTVAGLPELASVEDQEVGAVDLGTSQGVFDALKVVVARSDDAAPAADGVQHPATGSRCPGVFHRQPRPVTLSVLKPYADGTGSNHRLRVVQVSTEAVLDGDSPVGYVAFEKTKWSKKGAKAGFGETGALTSLSNDKASEAAAAAGAVADIPDRIAEALETSNKIVDRLQTLALQGIEHRIERLSKEKSLLEAEIARDELVETRGLRTELGRVTAELKLLQARQQHSEALRSLQAESATDAARLETEILRVQAELERARVERLKVEAELARLREGEG